MPLSVYVMMDCIDPCSNTILSTACTATVEGSVVTITATATIEHQGIPSTCSATCANVEASCELPAGLTAGSWTLSYDGSEVAFEVPSDVAICVN